MIKRQSLLPLALALAAPIFIACGDSDDDDVVHACIKSTACNVRAYPRVSDCVAGYRNLLVPDGMAPVYNAIYSCVVKASDCNSVRACYGVGATCDKGYSARCDGGRAYLCDLLDKTTFVYDCGAQGLSCQVQSAGGYAFDAKCTGGAGGGQAGAADCGDGSCDKTGKGCTTGNDFDRCAGDKLEACLGDEWVAFDCGKLGLGACFQSAQWGNCTGF
jgi:hypothetical protein